MAGGIDENWGKSNRYKAMEFKILISLRPQNALASMFLVYFSFFNSFHTFNEYLALAMHFIIFNLLFTSG